MKRTLLIVLEVILMGGLAFLLTSTNVLQGDFSLKTTSVKPIYTATPSTTETITTGTVNMGTIDTNPSTATNTGTKVTIAKDICGSLTLNPDAVTVTSNAAAGDKLDFTAHITIEATSGTKPTGIWSGLLLVTTEGAGTFTDEHGVTGNPLPIVVDQTHLDVNFSYTGGAANDEIYIYIADEEKNCNDRATITVTETPPATGTTTMACTSLNISPDTYTLSTGETTTSMTVTVKGSLVTAWSNFLKNLMAFSMGTGTMNTAMGDLIVNTSGSGTLSNNRNSSTGSSITVPVNGPVATVNVTYANPVGGDAITAYIKDHEKPCYDSLTLTAAPSTVSNTTSTSSSETSSSGTSSTVSTVTTTTSGGLSSDASTIMGDSDYICTDSYIDIPKDAWYADLVCRTTAAGVTKGRSYNTFVPGGFLTNAEAIKVLSILAGYQNGDATGLPAPEFLDMPTSNPFYSYIVWAVSKDVVRTRDAGLYFNPDNPISRQWFMIYANRMAGQRYTIENQNDIPFSDLKITDPGAYAMMNGYNTWTTTPEDGKTRIIEGYSNNTVQPNAQILRAEAMAIAQRIYLAWFSDQEVLNYE